jgi:hypothetical protein
MRTIAVELVPPETHPGAGRAVERPPSARLADQRRMRHRIGHVMIPGMLDDASADRPPGAWTPPPVIMPACEAA